MIYTRLLQASETATAELTDATTASCSRHNRGWRKTRTNASRHQVHPHQHHNKTQQQLVCKQFQHSNGFEIYRQLCRRFSIPLGTRSIGYLTKLLKPTFDTDNFEESFCNMGVRTFEIRTRQWTTTIPDSVKIVLLNETTEPLQQHLQLLSGSNLAYRQVKDTIIEVLQVKGGITVPVLEDNPCFDHGTYGCRTTNMENHPVHHFPREPLAFPNL